MFLLLLIFFLLTRILHLLFCFPESFTEELLRGSIAKSLIGGLKIPFFDYAADHYSGGSLVYGACTVPLFLLFGKSVFALRLTGILFQCGAFTVWHFFMRRFFGERPALYTSLLYLFSPPWLTLYSMYAMGVHAESLLFTAVGLFLLFRILYDGKYSLRDAACLGLVAGFGTYFSYQQAVSVVSFILFWCYTDRTALQKKTFYVFLLFFLIGFSPWFVYNSLYHFHGIDRMREAMTYPGWKRIFVIPFRFLKLATYKIVGMLSFNYREGIRYHPRITFLNIFYYAALLFSYFFLYRFGRRNKKTHFFFLFPLLFILAASLSRFDIATYECRYMVPLFPIFFAAIGLGLSQSEEHFSRLFQKVSRGTLVFLLAMGIKGEINLVSPWEFKLSLAHQGYSYYQLGGNLVYRDPENFGRVLELAKRLDAGLTPSERLSFHRGLSEASYVVEKPEDLKKYLPWIKSFDRTYQPLFLDELGHEWGLSESGVLSRKITDGAACLEERDQPYLLAGLIRSLRQSRMKPDRMVDYVLEQMETLSSRNQRALAYSLGKLSLWDFVGTSWDSVGPSFLNKIKRRREIEGRLPKKLLPLYYHGIGGHFVELYDPYWRKWPDSLLQVLGEMDEKWQEAIFWGAGFEAPLLYEDPYEYERMTAGIPLKFRKVFQQGLSDRFRWGGRNDWIEFEAHLTL